MLDIDKKYTNMNTTKKKISIIATRGNQYFKVNIEDIVYFYTVNKVVLVTDKEGQKYTIKQNLKEIQKMLDNDFFRANRKYIVNGHFIKSFRSIDRVKILVELTLPDDKSKIIISQVSARSFKEWIHNF